MVQFLKFVYSLVDRYIGFGTLAELAIKAISLVAQELVDFIKKLVEEKKSGIDQLPDGPEKEEAKIAARNSVVEQTQEHFSGSPTYVKVRTIDAIINLTLDSLEGDGTKESADAHKHGLFNSKMRTVDEYVKHMGEIGLGPKG